MNMMTTHDNVTWDAPQLTAPSLVEDKWEHKRVSKGKKRTLLWLYANVWNFLVVEEVALGSVAIVIPMVNHERFYFFFFFFTQVVDCNVAKKLGSFNTRLLYCQNNGYVSQSCSSGHTHVLSVASSIAIKLHPMGNGV